MSAQNVEIVRILFGHWNTREMSRSFELMHEDVVYEMADGMPGFADRYEGHDAIRGFWREWFAAWESVDVVSYDLRDDGDEVHATWTQDMRGKGSDVPVRVQQSATFAVSAGKVTRVHFFNSAVADH
jgi:ketosteroid isomerase-like protein